MLDQLKVCFLFQLRKLEKTRLVFWWIDVMNKILVIHPSTFLPFEMEIFLSFGYLECVSVQVFKLEMLFNIFHITVNFFIECSNEKNVLQEF